MKGNELICYLAIKYNGNFDRVLKAIKEKERVDDEDLKKLRPQIDANNYITILDPEYPECFKHIHTPPLVLFFKGNKKLLTSDAKKLAVIGTREPTSYGEKVTTDIVTELLKRKDTANTIIISGLARGIDTAAHEATLDAGGSTIAILGSGVDNIYPSANKDLAQRILDNDGLILSEYPGKVDPVKENFPMRNRIIAGLADDVLVTEAGKNSGTNYTVLFALQQGKDVMAVPNRITDAYDSCNKLIQDGAYLVTNADDVSYVINDSIAKNESDKDDEDKEDK